MEAPYRLFRQCPIRFSTAPEVDYGDSEYLHRSFALLQLFPSPVPSKSELVVSIAV